MEDETESQDDLPYTLSSTITTNLEEKDRSETNML